MGEVKALKAATPETVVRSACDREQIAGVILLKAFEGIIENEISDLTMRQMAILMLVANDNRMTMTEISRALDISMSSISRSCDALEQKKVVKRHRNGKYVNLAITPRGKAMIGRAIASITQFL